MDYLKKYGPAATPKTPKFQEGGAVPAAPGGAPAEAPQGGGGGGMEAMIQEYAQSRDPQLAVQIADAVVEMAMGGGQGGAPAPAMKKGGRMEAKAAPMFKKGGLL